MSVAVLPSAGLTHPFASLCTPAVSSLLRTTLPTRRRTQVTPAAWILIFEGEKMKESHHYFDMLSLLTQIGAIPGETAESAGA